MTNDEANDFIIAISAGELNDITAIAARIRISTEPRGQGR
jgi:hypothetical protein